MAVTSVNEYSASGGFDSQGVRTWTVLYKAETDSTSDGPVTVILSPLLPTFLSIYTFQSATEGDTLAFRQSLTAELSDPGNSWTTWDVTAVFSTKPVNAPDTGGGGAGNAGVTDPTLLPPEISGSFIKTLVPVEKDKDGNPVLNAAGDLFLDLVRDKSRPDLMIKKNYTAAVFDLDMITDVADSVNSKVFFGKGPRKWKFSSFVWRQLYWGITPYYEAAFGFEVNADTWDYEPANRGPRYDSGTAKLKFKDDEGLEYGDGLGELNADGTRRATTADPRVLYYDGTVSGLDPFEVYDTTDFETVLKVPTELPGV